MPRITVVTGAGRGIGKAVADLLRARGAAVIGVDLRGADLDADLSDQEERNRVASDIMSRSNVIDAVITCAGISLPDDGARAVSVNFFGTTRLLAALRPALARSTAPRVVVIASIATLFENDPATVSACLDDDEAAARIAGAVDGNTAYASSKRALVHWIRRTSARPEWGGAGILVNGVSPGTIKTAMANPILADPAARAALLNAVPLVVDDYAEAEDVAPLLAFLASPQNQFMVGQVMFADGGSDVLLRGDAIL